MASRNDSADFSTLVSRNAAREKFTKALRLYVGRGRFYSVKQLSNGTGIPDRLIEAAMASPDSEEYREPNLDAILSLSAFLGPEFTSEWLAPAGQGAFDVPEGDEPTDRIAVDAVQDAASLVGSPDTAELRSIGTRMMVRGARLREMADTGQPGLFGRRAA